MLGGESEMKIFFKLAWHFIRHRDTESAMILMIWFETFLTDQDFEMLGDYFKSVVPNRRKALRKDDIQFQLMVNGEKI